MPLTVNMIGELSSKKGIYTCTKCNAEIKMYKDSKFPPCSSCQQAPTYWMYYKPFEE